MEIAWMWDSLYYALNQVGRALLSVGSGFSLTSLAVALFIAAGYLIHRRSQQNRSLKMSTLVRGIFPGWMMRHASHRADIGFFIFNVFVDGMMFGWAILSYKFWSNLVVDGTTAAFGAPSPTMWPDLIVRAIITLVLFIAYEFGYWLDHYLKHRIPALWELHKVHHSANVLTPLTVFRMHPLDGVIFANILGISIGLANGVASYAFGKTTPQLSIDDTNLILVFFVHAYVHLQHTHLWIAFTGIAGRIFLSPAHHQIHHSNNPIHFDKNLGSCLAIWDWLFGTLYLPKKEPENLSFGVTRSDADVHSLSELSIAPVGRAAAQLAAPFRDGGTTVTAPATEAMRAP
jgi:sterol desaturase/sphingolipid hydroxylase (fatty acid hydroxylase superfamily)